MSRLRQKEYLITDVNRQGSLEVALVYRENGKGKKEHQRISPYPLIFDDRGEPNFEYGKDTELKRAEAAGMRSMRELANEGKKFVVWVSPPGGPENYPEGRLVVGWVKEVREWTRIECRGIPILETGEKLKEMVDALIERGAVSMDEIREVEDLRQEAVGIDGKNWMEFLDLCEEVFGNKKVWEAIRNGDDVVETEITERVVVEVMQELKVRGLGNNPYMLEQMMAMRGYGLMAGNHGGVNTPSPLGGAFNVLFSAVTSESLDPRLQYCEVHQVYFMKKKGVCPRCKGE